MKKILGIVVLGLLLSGCASTSLLEYRYETGGQLSSHSVSGWTDEEMVIKAHQECMKFNKKARAKNVIKRYEGGIGKILGEGGEYDIWIYDCYVPDESTNSSTSASSSNSDTGNSSASSSSSTNSEAERRKALVQRWYDPGYTEAGFPQKESFWIFLKSPPPNADLYAELACRIAKSEYNLSGFTITVWDFNKKKYGKARCY